MATPDHGFLVGFPSVWLRIYCIGSGWMIHSPVFSAKRNFKKHGGLGLSMYLLCRFYSSLLSTLFFNSYPYITPLLSFFFLFLIWMFLFLSVEEWPICFTIRMPYITMIPYLSWLFSILSCHVGTFIYVYLYTFIIQ